MDKKHLERLIARGLSISLIAKETSVSKSTVRYWLNKYCLKTLFMQDKKLFYKLRRDNHTQNIKYCLYCGKELLQRNNKFCSSQCVADYNYREYIKRWKNGDEAGSRGKYGISNHIRRYLFEKNGRKCCRCGWNKVNKISNTIPLIINHIDGNWENNSEDNLELICPNCDSLTPTYKFLNNGKGRRGRKQLI